MVSTLFSLLPGCTYLSSNNSLVAKDKQSVKLPINNASGTENHLKKQSQTLDNARCKIPITNNSVKKLNSEKSTKLPSKRADLTDKLAKCKSPLPYAVFNSDIKNEKKPCRDNKSRYHVVKEGQSLTEIADMHGLEREKLAELNNIKPEWLEGNIWYPLYPGDKLNLPVQKPEKVDQYLVKEGDSLTKIADRFNLSTTRLAEINDVEKVRFKGNWWYQINPGDQLKIPEKSEPQKAKAYQDNKAKISGIQGSLEGILGAGKTKTGFDYGRVLITRGSTLEGTVNSINCRSGVEKKLTVEQVRKLNNIRPQQPIKYGETLKIPWDYLKNSAPAKKFAEMNFEEKYNFLKERTISDGEQYISPVLISSKKYNIDPRLPLSIIWEESWFRKEAISGKSCVGICQLNPEYHPISDSSEENIDTAVKFLKQDLYDRYRSKGLDKKTSLIRTIASYKDGYSKTNNYIDKGRWDGRSIDRHPSSTTRHYLQGVMRRIKTHYLSQK